MKKLLALVLALAMALSLVAVAGAEEAKDLPRNETVYFGGQQWGPIVGWNPISPNMNNAMASSAAARGSRTIMFETLYMYNMLDGGLYPLLADGDVVWNDDLTEATVAIKAAAKWSDGTPVTADDMVATWDTAVLTQNSVYTGNAAYIDSITAVDGKVVIKSKLTADGKPVNPLIIKDFLTGTYVAQKAWLEKLAADHGNDAAAMLADPTPDVPYSGPYGPYFANDQIVAFVRNDAYWGQDASMWGKLPVPKYIAHSIYSDNDAALVAFKDGQIDCNQQFIANVQKLWEDEGLPIATYMDEAPYGICATMPTAWYNMEIPALQNVAVRKAIAMAVDYDDIIENAPQTTPAVETVSQKGYALPVTVNVTRQDGGTKATYNESTKKLEFSTGDKLFVSGRDQNDGGAGRFAGTLDYVSGGTFSGTIYTQNDWTDTADALFSAAFSRRAILLPNGYDSYNFLSISNNNTIRFHNLKT